MALRLSFDTTFLIDLQRERRHEGGPAHAFLRRYPSAGLALSSVALGEFAEGFDTPDHPLIDLVRSTHEVLPADDRIALVYARIARTLRARGALIGANDLWIAATALSHGLPLVTADEAHFSRVDGLDVRSHRPRARS